MTTLNKKNIEEKFITAEQEFSKRWQIFAKDRKFIDYSRQFTDEEIIAEFDTIDTTRNAVYLKQDFERSSELLTGKYYKEIHITAFNYNFSHPQYNSSNIVFNDYRFLALEGPQNQDNVQSFKQLLNNYNVKKIVRLTNDFENKIFKSENYWQGHLSQTSDNQLLLTFILPEEQPQSYNYYFINDWPDRQGIEAKLLLNFVQQIRRDYKPGELIAVHCSGGVGRTGTFIAAFLLLNEIDKQLKNNSNTHQLNLSIEEMVYKLTLQRAYLVGNHAQYLTLHKVVQQYLTTI